jgi:hypothetical protein
MLQIIQQLETEMNYTTVSWLIFFCDKSVDCGLLGCVLVFSIY